MNGESEPRDPVVPTDDAHPLVGTVLAERYRVDRFLGAGGMGAVYLGEHVLMRKPVALKVLHGEMTRHGEVVARFEREAVAAGRIDHPNVAAASDFGRLPDGSFYLVLEYVDGRSLSALIHEGPIARERALDIAEEIASALVAAHDAGVVHRDLKPDNVMLVAAADGRDHVKVLDFGIAKLDGAAEPATEGRALTRIGAVMGTVGYMAPEQALGQAVDHRADLYALGVVLYEMLAGTPPFVAEELSQIVAKQLTDSPPPLPEGTPPELSELIGRLLATSPGGRPGSAGEVLSAIRQLRTQAMTPPLVTTSVSGAGAAVTDATARTRAISALDAEAAASASRDAPPSRSGAVVAVVIAAVLLGAGLAWRAASPSSEPASALSVAVPSAATPSSVAVVPSAAPAPSAAPTTRVVETDGNRTTSVGGAPTSVTHTTVSESTTKTPDGRTVTTRTTKKTTVEHSEKRSSRRRTGPGGLYIPPPSQWFK